MHLNPHLAMLPRGATTFGELVDLLSRLGVLDLERLRRFHDHHHLPWEAEDQDDFLPAPDAERHSMANGQPKEGRKKKSWDEEEREIEEKAKFDAAKQDMEFQKADFDDGEEDDEEEDEGDEGNEGTENEDGSWAVESNPVPGEFHWTVQPEDEDDDEEALEKEREMARSQTPGPARGQTMFPTDDRPKEVLPVELRCLQASPALKKMGLDWWDRLVDEVDRANQRSNAARQTTPSKAEPPPRTIPVHDQEPVQKQPFVFIANRLTFLTKTKFPVVWDTSCIETISPDCLFVGLDRRKNPQIGLVEASEIAHGVNSDPEIQREVQDYLDGTEWSGLFCIPYRHEVRGETRFGFLFSLKKGKKDQSSPEGEA